MTTFFVLLLIAAVVAFVFTKKSAQPAKFVINKKPEPVIPVVTTEIVAEVVETKKVRKPRAKKITSKKKTNPPK